MIFLTKEFVIPFYQIAFYYSSDSVVTHFQFVSCVQHREKRTTYILKMDETYWRQTK